MTPGEKLVSKAELIILEFKALRTLQKTYFRHRDPAILDKCKIQEKKVDQLIEDYYEQPTLF